MSIETGGPAFPVPDSHDANGQVQYGANGMTLRDYFAAKAMVAFISAAVTVVKPSTLAKTVASAAYEIADEMLKKRGQE